MSNHHPGNEWYRRLIKSNRPLYRACPKHTKLLVAKAIVQAVEQQHGRFLERSKKNGFWYVVSYKRAVDKTSQGLRERERECDQLHDKEYGGKNSSTTTGTCSDTYNSDSGSSSNDTKKKLKTKLTKMNKKRKKDTDNDVDYDDCRNVSSDDDNDDYDNDEAYVGEIPEGFRSSSSIRPPDLVELASVAISNEKNRYNRKNKSNSNSISKKESYNLTTMTTTIKKNSAIKKPIKSKKLQETKSIAKNSKFALKKNLKGRLNDNDSNDVGVDSDNGNKKRKKMSVEYDDTHLTNRPFNNIDTDEHLFRNNKRSINFDGINRSSIINYNMLNNNINNNNRIMQQYDLPELQATESTVSTYMPLPPSMELRESSMFQLLRHTKLLTSVSTSTTIGPSSASADGGISGSVGMWNSSCDTDSKGIHNLNGRNTTGNNESFSDIFNASALNFMRRSSARDQSGLSNSYYIEEVQQRQYNNRNENYFIDNNDYQVNNVNNHSYDQVHNRNQFLDLLLKEQMRREQIRNGQQQQLQQQQQQQQQQSLSSLQQESVMDDVQENCEDQKDDKNSTNKTSTSTLNEMTSPPPSSALTRLKSQVSDWLRNSFWPVSVPVVEGEQVSLMVENQQHNQQNKSKQHCHDDATMTENDNDSSQKRKRMKCDEKDDHSDKLSPNSIAVPLTRQEALLQAQRVLASIPPPKRGSCGESSNSSEKNVKKGKDKDTTQELLSSIKVIYPPSLVAQVSSSALVNKVNDNTIMQQARGRRSRKSLIDDDDDDDAIGVKPDPRRYVHQNQQTSKQNYNPANNELLYHLQKQLEQQRQFNNKSEKIRHDDENGESAPNLPTFDDRKISITLPSLPEFAPVESTFSLFNGLLDQIDGTNDDDHHNIKDGAAANRLLNERDIDRVHNMIEGAKSLRLLSSSVSNNVDNIEIDNDNSVTAATSNSQPYNELEAEPLGELEKAVSASLLQLASATPNLLLSSLTTFFDQGGVDILSTSLNNMKKNSSTAIATTSDNTSESIVTSSSDAPSSESTSAETVSEECDNQCTDEKKEAKNIHIDIDRTDRDSKENVKCEPTICVTTAKPQSLLDSYDETTAEAQMRVVTTAVSTS
jgi:hypothetical protein